MASAARWQAVCAADSARAPFGVDREVHLGSDLWGARRSERARWATCQVQPGSPRLTGMSAADQQVALGAAGRHHGVDHRLRRRHQPVSPGWSGQVWSTGWKGVTSTTTSGRAVGVGRRCAPPARVPVVAPTAKVTKVSVMTPANTRSAEMLAPGPASDRLRPSM